MATYGLKYYAEFRNNRGQDYRLEIHQRSYSSSSKKIGTLAGCVLEVQGNMGSIIAPIIKTQLRFTVIDAPDMPAVSGTKFGGWEEFFTPDATLYKVIFKCYIGSSWTTEWSGYITPDSWQESLDYRGAITITARDNIGHLKDFPYSADGWNAVDGNGLVEIRYIFSKAMSLIDFPMTFVMESYGTGQYSADVIEDEDGNHITDASVNAALFDGMNWYDILEQSLEAIGYVLRFVGNNKFVACSLRNQPKLAHYTDATGSQALEFYGGNLELDPAVKRIEEEIDYKFTPDAPLKVLDSFQFTTGSAYRCIVEGNGSASPVALHSAPLDILTNHGKAVWDNNSEMFNPDTRTPDDYLINSEGSDGWKQYAMIPGNREIDDPSTSFRFFARTAAATITINLTPFPLSIIDSGSDTGKVTAVQYSLYKIKYQVSFISSDGNTTRYWNGEGWVNDNEHTITQEYDSENEYATTLEIVLADCKDIGSGYIVVRIANIIYKRWDDSGTGVYARVSDIKIELNATKSLQSNKVTTINNDAYNVLLSRRPLFGALSKAMGYVSPGNYLAGIFNVPFVGAYPDLYPYMVRFTDQYTLVPLPVLIHEQILCYYYGAARVLQGAAAPPNNALFRFNKLCTYKGKTYLFQGGTMDYLSGTINNATFREFLQYTSLWSGNPPSYDEQIEYNR